MKELTLEITNKCYLNCSWCSSSSVPNGYLVPDDKVYALLKKYRPECDVVRFSGGEPTLHPEIGGFLWYAKERLGYKTILLTNGLSGFLSPSVDEYYINVVSSKSILKVLALYGSDLTVTVGVVLVKGNEEWIRRALDTSLLYEIPIRLLVLQRQGRGVNCEPLELIGWTGNKGCSKENKITIAHDGKVVTCSALKYGECSIEGGR